MIYKSNHTDEVPTWGVVTTCREPTQLIVAFVAHYIGLGAARVHVYIDAPQPDLETLLAAIPQACVRVCDDSYWNDHIGKSRPSRQEHRQLINAFDAYTRTDVAWLAHFDADEFLHADLPVGAVLAAQPQELDFASINVRERAFVTEEPQQSLFEGVFRRPLPNEWEDTDILFAAGQRFMRRGLLGYSHSKSIMRTGQHLVPGIHTPRRPRENRDIPLRGWPIHRARLLHFDGLTSLHWSAKLLRAAAAGVQNYKTRRGRKPEVPRANQITRMQNYEGNLDQAFEMHQHLKTIPMADLDRLRALGLVEDYKIDPAADIAALGLGATIDLSRAAFDLALTLQQPQVADWQRPWESILARNAARDLTPAG